MLPCKCLPDKMACIIWLLLSWLAISVVYRHQLRSNLPACNFWKGCWGSNSLENFNVMVTRQQNWWMPLCLSMHWEHCIWCTTSVHTIVRQNHLLHSSRMPSIRELRLIVTSSILPFAGMHKKSIEAAQKLKEEEDDDVGSPRSDSTLPSKPVNPESPEHPNNMLSTNSKVPLDKEDFRSESIASLRAKALSYSARIMQEGLSRFASHQDQPLMGLNLGHSKNDSDPTDLSIHQMSSFATPKNDSDDSSDSLDPANWLDYCIIVINLLVLHWPLNILPEIGLSCKGHLIAWVLFWKAEFQPPEMPGLWIAVWSLELSHIYIMDYQRWSENLKKCIGSA